MTTAESLNALADRVEREEPSRELDRAIEIEVRGMLAVTSYPPPYTTSLDAAVTLVPEGYRVAHIEDLLLRRWWAKLQEVHSSAASVGGEWRYLIHEGSAQTAAAALTAAALRARAALLTDGAVPSRTA